jgi:hypothetical protein
MSRGRTLKNTLKTGSKYAIMVNSEGKLGNEAV